MTLGQRRLLVVAGLALAVVLAAIALAWGRDGLEVTSWLAGAGSLGFAVLTLFVSVSSRVDRAHHESEDRRPTPARTQYGLVVKREHARIRHEHGAYHVVVERELFNEGATPITHFPVRIAVDRYPSDPERSMALYKNSPLKVADFDLRAWYGTSRAMTMDFETTKLANSILEVSLLFRNSYHHFPLYPGQTAIIEYAYTIEDGKWGPWFRRRIRFPTEHLVVSVDLPACLAPVCSGTQSADLARYEAPLDEPIKCADEGLRRVYSYSKVNPPLHTSYCLRWNFLAHNA